MAAKALQRQLERCVFFVPTMRALTNRMSTASSTAGSSTAGGGIPAGDGNDPLNKWTVNPRFPLPGNCALDPAQFQLPVETPVAKQPLTLASTLNLLEDENIRKLEVMKQMVDNGDPDENPYEEEPSEDLTTAVDTDKVECTIQTCPTVVRKSFWQLFPGVENEGYMKDLTVITICQQTNGDMTCWSEEVEQERDELMGQFVENAIDICEQLKEVGFWADFIDPSSGLAYHSGHSNNALFETDDRFIHLGFLVEDLGCCRVIKHKKWGTQIFVGTIFTDAPSNFRAFQQFNKR